MTVDRRRGAQLVAALAVTGIVGSGCALQATPPSSDVGPPASVSVPTAIPTDVASDAEILLSFEATEGVGSVLLAPTDSGTAGSLVSLTTVGGGRVVAAAGPGSDLAAQFPRADDPARPLAAFLVAPRDVDDPLAPGEADFAFGADLALDEVSEGRYDNGDNVLQRGLYADESQYKLQVDHGIVSCRVAGRDGEAVVAADAEVVRGRWHRVVCTRLGVLLRLDVSTWDGTSWQEPTRWEVSATTGDVFFDPSAESAMVTPISVGAKVGIDGQIPRDAGDQFNGALNNVFVDVRGPS